MTEKICSQGHVIDDGKEICSRCGGSEPVVATDAPVEETVAEEVESSTEEAIEVEVPAEESEESVEETPAEESTEEEAPVEATEGDETPLG